MVHTSLLLLDVDSEQLEDVDKLPGILIEYGEYSPEMAVTEKQYTEKGYIKYHYGLKGGLRYYVIDFMDFKEKFCHNGYVILDIDASNQMTFSSFINLCAPEKEEKWLKSKYNLISNNCQDFSAHAIGILKPIYIKSKIHLGVDTINNTPKKESIIPDKILKVLNIYKKK